MSACDLVVSDIIHTRHSGEHHPASHVLRRSGLSIWIDLDRLHEANRQSLFFSGAWTGFGFHEDGLKSAVAIAKTLGVEIPWDTKVAAFPKSLEPMQGIA